MSRRKKSKGNSDTVLRNVDFSSSSRITSALVFIVLTLCALIIPICGQTDQPTCGKRQTNIEFLVAKGDAAKLGDWPWHAALYRLMENKLTYFCGGSILDKHTILTAAHCLFIGSRPMTEDQLSVHVGRVDLNEITTALQVLVVSKLIIHGDFDLQKVPNDIAVIKLASDIVMTQFVQPVCLWSKTGEQDKIVGKQGTVVGFGANEKGVLPGFLQEAALAVVDVFTCLENDRNTYGRFLTSNMYCAGGKHGASACRGDSGGGMFFEVAGVWYLRGIVSFIAKGSNDKCDGAKYTVFTDVSKYLEWIVQSIHTPRSLENLGPCQRVFSGTETMCYIYNRFEHGFLLVGQDNHVVRVPLAGGRSFPVAEAFKSEGIVHDCAEGRFYWSDTEAHQIRSANYDGTDRRPVIVKDIVRPQGVAVDWISRRLYWADWDKKTIEVARLDNTDARTVLISSDLVNPYAIAVDPSRSKLYWSDWHREGPIIEWSNLDGTGRQLLVEIPQIKRAYSIQVSMGSGELCYTDSGTKKVECINPYSKKIRTVASNLTFPFGLTLTDELFYWTDLGTKTIESSYLNGVRRRITGQSPEFENRQTYAMTAVTDKCLFIRTPCTVNNGDCPANTICLVNPSASFGRSCI